MPVAATQADNHYEYDLSQAEAVDFIGPYGMTGDAGMDTFTNTPFSGSLQL